MTSGVELGFEVREETKKRMRRMKERERSKRKEFGERSFMDLSLFQAFAMENLDVGKFSEKIWGNLG